MTKRSTVLFVVLASLLVVIAQANPFLAYGGGHGGGGGCGGGGAGADDHDHGADEEPPVPSPVAFVISGKPSTGKTFLATRLHTLLNAHSHWNMSAHYVTIDDLVYDSFAETNQLDAHKLKVDAFYRYDHADALKSHFETVKQAKGGEANWDAVRLEYLASSFSKIVEDSPKSRHVFVIDGLNDQASVTFLDGLTKSQDYLKVFPGQALNPIYVQVTAPDTVREERGLKPAKPAVKAADEKAQGIVIGWAHTFNNDEQGVEGIVKMDNFLASVLLREAAN